MIATNLTHPLNSESKLSPHEVQVSFSFSASYVIVTMSHNSTSLKQLLLFLQNVIWREYEAPSTTKVFCFVLLFKQVYGRPVLWLINAIHFSFPWNYGRDLNEIIRDSSSFKISLYFWQIYSQIWPPCPLIVWCISDVCSDTLVWISTKLYRKKVLTTCITSLNQLVFLLVQPNNYTIALVSYWLTRFSTSLQPLHGFLQNV